MPSFDDLLDKIAGVIVENIRIIFLIFLVEAMTLDNPDLLNLAGNPNHEIGLDRILGSWIVQMNSLQERVV